MVDHITGLINVKHYRGIVVPKGGNAQFGVAVAHALRLEPVVIREWRLYKTFLETNLPKGRVLMVDDVWANGDILLPTADIARRAGYNLAEAFLLIERREGRVRTDLGNLTPPIKLSSHLAWGDEELDALKVRADMAGQELLQTSLASSGLMRLVAPSTGNDGEVLPEEHVG